MSDTKTVKIKDIFRWYNEGGIELLEKNLNDPLNIVNEDSWSEHIKNSLNKKLYKSTAQELDELILKHNNFL